MANGPQILNLYIVIG